MQTIKIGDKKIGRDYPTFIVAEISCNHRQKFENAAAIIRAAAEAGADAVKIQTYTPDTMTIDSGKKWFVVGGETNPKQWKKRTFYDLYKEAYTPWDWTPRLQKIARDLGLIFFSTPFDDTAVDFLEKLRMPAYKIAAYEANDIPLLARVARTKKPVIISVGFQTLPEIRLSVKTLRQNGARDIILLHSTASYEKEGDKKSADLRTMLNLEKRFGIPVGLSDNMGGIEVPALAAAIGASVIEKHLVVKHDKNILDDRFSLDKKEFAELVRRVRSQEMLLGKVQYGPRTEAEKYNRSFRRSLFAVKDIKKGEKLTKENIRSIRPGNGLEPKYYYGILGKEAIRTIERGTPLNWKLIKKGKP
ncbi:pseudaminic acid synthase [bacterium]|nr:pseudaminic acid synthase [bacterium]